MAENITVAAVRLALGLQQLRAEVASSNIARANTPGFQPQRVDGEHALSLLRQIAAADARTLPSLGMPNLAVSQAATVVADPSLAAGHADVQVAEMVSAGLEYQALSESLSRHFGLMRLALSGRAGA